MPSTWRPIVEDPATLQLFLDFYGASKPPLSSMSLECLVSAPAPQPSGPALITPSLLTNDTNCTADCLSTARSPVHGSCVPVRPLTSGLCALAGEAGVCAAVLVHRRHRAEQVPEPPCQGDAGGPADAAGPSRARQLPRILPPAGPPQNQLPACRAGTPCTPLCCAESHPVGM